MKLIKIISILIISFSAYCDSDEESRLRESLKHFNKKNYFTALDLVAGQYIYKTPSPKVKAYLQKLIEQTGTYYFNTYDDLKLRKLNIPTTDLLMAKRNLYLGKYKYAFKRLKRIDKDNRFFPEALLVKGTIYHKKKMYKEAIDVFNSCSLAANKWENQSKTKQQKYFAVIKETCIINIARIKYKNEQFQEASNLYGIIPKASYKWPYTLIERAWSHYNLGDFNRSLGIIMTYDSPLLESYFMPEAEVLKALSYYQLCLYEDSLKVIENFYTTYKPRSEQLRAVLSKQNTEDLYFFNLMFKPISEMDKKNKFLRNIVIQIQKRIKYNLDLSTLYAINTEIYRSSDDSNKELTLRLQRDIKEQINHYIKTSMYKFINEIHSLSSELFNLKLEILSKQRDLVYKNKVLKQDRSRGNLENIKANDTQEFYTFKSAFWADELGDYSFALSSMCKEKKVGPNAK